MNTSDSKELKLKHILLGGFFSQLVVAPTVTAPLERVKVLLQVFPGRFNGQLDVLSYILRTEGRKSVAETAVIGGVSGVVGWIVEIPFDNIKNRHQVCLKKRPLLVTLQEILGQGGFKQLYKGSTVILVRAFPANAATFIAYEWTIRGLVSVD